MNNLVLPIEENRGGMADLSLLRTLLENAKSPFVLVVYICKFGSFKNPFVMITSLSELYFRFRRIILLVQTKKVISMNYGSMTSC